MGNATIAALFLALAVIILAARAAGGLARHFGQPRVLGELLIGVLLGPTLLDLNHWPIFHGAALDELLHAFAEIGVMLLMFLVGLEVNLGELARARVVAIAAGLLGAALPVLLTLPIGLLFGLPANQTIFAGIALAATSVSISAQVLLELGVLRTRVGNALLATALVDDVVAILFVSVALAVFGRGSSGENSSILVTVARMVAYLVGAFLLAWYGLPRVMRWISHRPVLEQAFGAAGIGFAAALLFGWSAEALGGVATITGAFIAGVGLSRADGAVKHEIERAASYAAFALFVPVFFINVGLQINLRTFTLSTLPLALLLLIGAVASKVLGCGAGGLLGRMNRTDALRLGVCMVARGEVGLIIASLGLSTGLFERNSPLFSALFLVILLTTLIAPLLVRQAFPHGAATKGMAI